MSDRHFSSRSIHLGTRLLASTAVAGTLFLTGCDKSTTESGIYENAAQCVAAEIFTPKYCNEHYLEARADHERLAPHYDSKDDCEKDWGSDRCEQPHGTTVIVTNTNHGGYYSPRMSGYWTGYTDTPSETQGVKPTRQTFTYPVYKSGDNEIYSPKTDQTFDGYGRVSTKPDFSTARTVMEAPRAVFGRGASFSEGSISRGGFGASARGFGFGVGE